MIILIISIAADASSIIGIVIVVIRIKMFSASARAARLVSC